MDRLTDQELEFTLQCVRINRLKLSPIPSNNVEDTLCRIIESKLEKYLESRLNNENT